MPDQSRVGEVVEASTTEFVAQCYELYQVPPLGSLVKTGDGQSEIYGIVRRAETASLQTDRHPIARGKDEASQEDIYRSSPQLLKLLKTEFAALVVGHRQGERICQYLAPTPARIHAFVHACTADEVRAFSASLDFLSLLVNSRTDVPSDELIAAALRQMAQAQPDGHAFLVGAGKELAVLLSGQYIQLRSVLGRLK